jgi:hypothetical protein
MSVNKIKVKGVSNKHKLNKRLLFGVHKTPMKTNINANNALRRHIGVKRNNNNNASPDIKNSLNNSIEDKSKMNVIENNISNNKQENSNNKEYSCINMSQRENSALNKNNKENINMSDKKLIDLKNNIVTDNLKKSKKNENEEISSSNEEEGENDEEEIDNKRNNIKINVNPTGDEVDQILDEIARNNDKYENVKRYKINKIFDNLDKGETQSEKNNPKFELIQINKKRSPTIVINNNINVNFDNKSIGVSNALSKFKNFKIK